jgi:hypothetical protein
MAELVDALGSGPSGGNTVEVRVLFWAPVILRKIITSSICLGELGQSSVTQFKNSSFSCKRCAALGNPRGAPFPALIFPDQSCKRTNRRPLFLGAFGPSAEFGVDAMVYSTPSQANMLPEKNFPAQGAAISKRQQ